MLSGNKGVRSFISSGTGRKWWVEEVKKLKNKARREQKLGEVDTYLVKMEGLGEWEVRDGEQKTKEPYSIRLENGSWKL